MTTIGTIFGQPTTSSFSVLLDEQIDSEKLKFSFVEVGEEREEGEEAEEIIIAKIKEVSKKNPLLSEDQASFISKARLSPTVLPVSTEFTAGYAECEVIGALNKTTGKLGQNTRTLAPGMTVMVLSEASLRTLFSSDEPNFLQLGLVENFGAGTDVGVALDGDSIATKHLCIFGMTGTGKTNTAAALAEEYIMRGYRLLIFDPHDDYTNLDVFSDEMCQKARGLCPAQSGFCPIVESLANENPSPVSGSSEEERQQHHVKWCYRVLGTVSASLGRIIEQVLQEGCPAIRLSTDQLDEVWGTQIRTPLVRRLSVYPMLRFYPDAPLLTVRLMEGIIGEDFSGAQRRYLLRFMPRYYPRWFTQTGVDLVNALDRFARRGAAELGLEQADEETNELMLAALLGKLAVLRNLLESLERDSEVRAIDIDELVRTVVSYDEETAYATLLSLSRLSDTLRKTMVYAVISRLFYQFKYGVYNASPSRGDVNAYPIVLLLEEARDLIPAGDAQGGARIAASLARSATRQVSMEGRKFNLGLTIVSQKPSSVDEVTTSQANTFILHQLASPEDQSYVRKVTEGLSQEDLDLIKNLEEGVAVVSGDAVKVRRSVLTKVRLRYSREGIEKPTPLSDTVSGLQELRQTLLRNQVTE
jgi:DNA helicase HerA-like ATPase